MDFSFIGSTRFQAAVVIALLQILVNNGVVAPEMAEPLQFVCLTHIGLRTVDRAAEKLGKKK
jgi:hypothetical protein